METRADDMLFSSFTHLLPGLGVWRGIDEVTAPYAAPSGAVVGNRHGGFDELIVNHVSFIGHDTAACELVDAPLWSRAHHLAVNGEVLCGDSCWCLCMAV